MSEQADVTMAEARFGIEVEQFLSSDIGRYMVGRAENEEHEALQALAQVDPIDAKKVERLQNQVWRARSIQQWLAQAVQAGLMAQHQIEIEDANDGY
jgi:hypothetical protein